MNKQTSMVSISRLQKKSSTLKKIQKRKQKSRTPPSLSKLKKELDRVFSLWVRREANRCYTCGAGGNPKTLQNGHFIPRQYLATRWEPDNCRPQCAGCNIWGKGKFPDFEENLVKELGAERVKQLKDKRHELWKLDRTFYETEIARYKALLETVDN